MLRVTKVLTAALLLGAGGTALACELPPLVAIPAKKDIGDRAPQIQAEVQQYYDAMKVYSDCIQAELDAAGGDSAQAIVKAVLVQRNNSAVAEVQNVMKAFQESVGGPAPAAAPDANGGGGRRRDR